MDSTELRETLKDFHGSLDRVDLGPLFKHALLSEGVAFLVENANCWWLVTDALAWMVDRTPEVNFDDWFVSMKLLPNPDGSALLTLSDGASNELYRHEYTMTTFPLEEGIELWIEWDEGPERNAWMVLLPSEH